MESHNFEPFMDQQIWFEILGGGGRGGGGGCEISSDTLTQAANTAIHVHLRYYLLGSYKISKVQNNEAPG